MKPYKVHWLIAKFSMLLQYY